jgi:hypothetical protein
VIATARSGRDRADDRLRADPLATGQLQLDAAPAVDRDRGHHRAEADALAELGADPQRDLGRALRAAQPLPLVEVIEPATGQRRLLAQRGQQRRALRPVAGQRQRGQLVTARDRRQRVLLAQPRSEAERVEAAPVRVAPRVVGIDGRDQPRELALDPPLVGVLGAGHPRGVIADMDAVDQPPRHLPRLGDVAGLDRQAQLGDELQVGVVATPDHLAAHLDAAPVGQRGPLDAAADPLPGLEHDDVGAAADEVAGRRESRQPGTHHHDVGHVSPPAA